MRVISIRFMDMLMFHAKLFCERIESLKK